MISAMQSALSALQAYGTKIHANANNIANGATEGYKQTRVILATVEPGGVKAKADKLDTPGPNIYTETTDGLELIEQSNVELSSELPQMMLNSHYYTANLKSLQAANELLDNVLDLKA
ncbi:MAG TPA: flagellar basal body rod C-terminal domain-containing protein [Desulfopila sp.]|nr:flagellar basal body rod C-terminal domain-containing protein [Desulfopila sp.]